MSLKSFLLIFCILSGECEIAVIIYFAIKSAPQTVRWIARWKDDVKRAWQDEEPNHFK